MAKLFTRMIVIIILVLVAIVVLLWLVRAMEPRLAFFPFAGEDLTPRDVGVAYTPLTIDTPDGERLRAWHLPREDAIAQVVYFHGNGGNLSNWADVFIGLHEKRLDVVALDYRGYGVSTGSPSEQGLYRDVDATIAYVDAQLRRPDVPLLYWGRSLGATMAAYAASRGAPDGVVLENGFPAARMLFERNPLMWVLSVFSTYRFPTAEWMADVQSPTLVIHGDRDRVIPYRFGQRLYASIGGPKRFVTMPGGDHNDPAPADAELYWNEVRTFIGSLAGPR